jgi:hypothetical protein
MKDIEHIRDVLSTGVTAFVSKRMLQSELVGCCRAGVKHTVLDVKPIR